MRPDGGHQIAQEFDAIPRNGRLCTVQQLEEANDCNADKTDLVCSVLNDRFAIFLRHCLPD